MHAVISAFTPIYLLLDGVGITFLLLGVWLSSSVTEEMPADSDQIFVDQLLSSRKL